MNFADLAAIYEPQRIGAAEVLHVAVGGRPIARLMLGEELQVEDTAAERATWSEFFERARGDVLMSGLGLGLGLRGLKARSITVVEKSPDIIRLSAAKLPHVRVVCADIREWIPDSGSMWDTIFFDHYTTITPSVAEAMPGLHSKFRPFLRQGGWMDSWRFGCGTPQMQWELPCQ